MLIKVVQTKKQYQRTSKNGVVHTFYRYHNTAILRCDNCGSEFYRRTRDMDHRRLSQDHTHVCPKCPSKKVAQNKSVESRKFWNTTVDKEIDIDSI